MPVLRAMHPPVKLLHATSQVTTQLMELSSSQHLDGSISLGSSSSSPCSERLDDDVRRSLGSPESSFIDMYPAELSFIDMYPAEFFTVRRTTPEMSDFNFDRPVVADDATPSPMLLVSASRIFHGGLLLPCEPGSAAQVHSDGVDIVPNVSQRSDSLSPMFESTQITASSCSGAMSDAGSNNLGWRQRLVCAGGSSSSSPPPWKMLSNYLRFLVPLCRKVRELRPRSRVSAPGAATTTPGTTSSDVDNRCHGNADAAVYDAILYCKKSSGQAVLPD